MAPLWRAYVCSRVKVHLQKSCLCQVAHGCGMWLKKPSPWWFRERPATSTLCSSFTWFWWCCFCCLRATSVYVSWPWRNSWRPWALCLNSTSRAGTNKAHNNQQLKERLVDSWSEDDFCLFPAEPARELERTQTLVSTWPAQKKSGQHVQFQTQLVDLKGYISSKCSKQHSKTKGHAATQSHRAEPKTCTRTAWLQCLFEPKPNDSILARCHISQVDRHASGSNCSTSVNLRCPLLSEHAFLNRA